MLAAAPDVEGLAVQGQAGGSPAHFADANLDGVDVDHRIGHQRDLKQERRLGKWNFFGKKHIFYYIW